MSRFLSERLMNVTPYTPGEQPQDQKYIKLNTNESPYPPSPAVLDAVSRAEVEKLRLYSDPACAELLNTAAKHFGLKPSRIIPLKEDFTLDPTDYYGLGATIVLANPNAPTGLALPRSAIEGILKANPDNVVIVDEAYVDFGGESCVPLIDQYENLLVVRWAMRSSSLT